MIDVLLVVFSFFPLKNGLYERWKEVYQTEQENLSIAEQASDTSLYSTVRVRTIRAVFIRKYYISTMTYKSAFSGVSWICILE